MQIKIGYLVGHGVVNHNVIIPGEGAAGRGANGIVCEEGGSSPCRSAFFLEVNQNILKYLCLLDRFLVEGR
jgi:hypothetical protein